MLLLEGLGTLTTLPREIRDKIYNHVLDFASPEQCWIEAQSSEEPDAEDGQPQHRTSLLQASKRIHSEAEPVLYRVNEFAVMIDREYSDVKDNKTVMGRPGYRVDFGLQLQYGKYGEIAFMKSPPKPEMLRHLSFMHFQIGTHCGIKEYDIVPTTRQILAGPERPTFRSLLEVTEELCQQLRMCHQIQVLRLSIRSIEQSPGSIEKVLDPIRRLRRIKETNAVVFAMEDDRWVYWNLKGSYGRYLNKIMAMREGSIAARYVGDAKEPNQSDKDIFDKVGGEWLGGSSFSMPPGSDNDSADDDDDDEMDAGFNDIGNGVWEDEAEEDGFQMFMEAMNNGDHEGAFAIANGPLGPGFPVPPHMAAGFFDAVAAGNNGMPMPPVPGDPEIESIFPHLYQHYVGGSDKQDLDSEEEDEDDDDEGSGTD